MPVERSTPSYYEAFGQSHDELLRCKDCKALVLASVLRKVGSCLCGNRRVAEITMLSPQEMCDIETGVIEFPHRDLFLKEFRGIDVS